MTTMVHLFAGDNEMIYRGMDSYVNTYDDLDLAIRAANCGDFEWAQIVEVQPDRLHTVNMGKWDNKRRRMHWMDPPVILSQYQVHLRTFMTVLKEGALLFGELPDTQFRSMVKSRITQLREDLQQPRPKMNEDEARVANYYCRQILTSMIRSFKKTPTDPRSALGKSINRWLGQAALLLKETRDIQFRIDLE